MRHFALIVVALAGCGGNNRPHITLPDMAGQQQGGGDMATDVCSEKAKLVYVVDASGKLSSFEPSTLTFTDIGTVNCGGEPAGSTNSMAIDRNAFAWMNFQSGKVYRVDTTSLDCQPTSWMPNPNGFSTFGMGFSTNQAGGMDETLYIAGGNVNNQLASLDTTSMIASYVGPLPSWPELTGTGDAKLWGFFPDPNNARIAEIDKTNASLGSTIPLPQLNGDPMAWAFAFWGGDFWIFYQRTTDTSTHVWHVAIFDGGMQITDAIPNTGREIVGAGVSTCAPVTIG